MPQFANKRRVRHSAEKMFDLVADVERYPEFVPLCQSLKIKQRTQAQDGTEIIVADMTVVSAHQRDVHQSRHAGPIKPENSRRVFEGAVQQT